MRIRIESHHPYPSKILVIQSAICSNGLKLIHVDAIDDDKFASLYEYRLQFYLTLLVYCLKISQLLLAHFFFYSNEIYFLIIEAS